MLTRRVAAEFVSERTIKRHHHQQQLGSGARSFLFLKEQLKDIIIIINLGAGPVTTEMVHDRARAPSRQTLRVAVNEVRSRVAPRGGANLFLFSQTGISRGT
jgi:hypothetical protein